MCESGKTKVLVWTTGSAATKKERPLPYPVSIGDTIAEFLRDSGDFEITVTIDDEAKLETGPLSKYSALVMWAHGEAIDMDTQHQIVEAVELGGLGFVGLHSILIPEIYPVITQRLLGATSLYDWEEDVPMRITAMASGHEILDGITECDYTGEAYYEPLRLAEDVQPLLSMVVRGPGIRQVHRCEKRYAVDGRDVRGLVSRICWTRQVGKGRVFYFQPGHETYPVYNEAVVQRLLFQGLHWVCQLK